MPRLDGSGPTGSGELTGGGRGLCMSDEPDTVDRFAGFRGRGFFGRGPFGFRRIPGGAGRGAGAGIRMRGGRGGWLR